MSLLLSYLRVPEAVSHGAKRPGRDADRSPSLVRMLRIRGCIMRIASLWSETKLTERTGYWCLVCVCVCAMCHVPQIDRLTVSVPLSILVPPKDPPPPQFVLSVASDVRTGQEENIVAGICLANEIDWHKIS
jgi:hypothetical protein